jgi:predicted Zn-dependent peptidase
MKKICYIIIIFICTGHLAQAQVDRSEAPKPGPAPAINIGSPATFTTANGIKVFVVENHTVPKVTVSLILDRDPVLEKDKAGYVEMEGQLMRRGTATMSKSQLDEAIDFLGGYVRTGSASASASALTHNFEKLFAIYSDIILHPAFPDSELAKIKNQTLSGLEASKDDPDAITSNVTAVVNFGKDFPYGEVETDTTVNNITLEDIKNYYNTYWKPNIGYMAFVGDITTEHARALVNKYLGSWQKGKVPEADYTVPPGPEKTSVIVVNRPAAVQTNINITSPVVLKPGVPDNFPVGVMNQILGGGSAGWLFQDLREKHGYTYGAYSRIGSDPLVSSFSASAAVRTAVTDSALMRFMYELKRIRDDKVDQAKLDSVKNQISGDFALSLESPSRIAQFAINIARYNMPADYYKNYLKSIAAVTAGDVQKVAQQYVSPDRANIVLVGNAKEFAGKLSPFGPVRYVDIYGNPVEAPASRSVPADVTAETVISNYLEAIGGEDKLKSVKDLSLKADAAMMGQKIAIQQQFLLPDKFLMTMTLPAQNMTVMKMLVNGDSASMESMGHAIPMTDDRKAEMKEQAEPFPELNFLDGKHQLKLNGIEDVNGAEAYAVEVTDEKGKKATYYFDTKTNYEVRKVSSMKTPQGETSSITDLSDYKEVDGIKFPFSVSTQNGPQKMSMTVSEVKINSGLKDTGFK